MEGEGRYCITYTAVSDLGAVSALLITRDFKEYERHGAVFPLENKDVAIFPNKIGGLYYACHRWCRLRLAHRISGLHLLLT